MEHATVSQTLLSYDYDIRWLLFHSCALKIQKYVTDEQSLMDFTVKCNQPNGFVHVREETTFPDKWNYRTRVVAAHNRWIDIRD